MLCTWFLHPCSAFYKLTDHLFCIMNLFSACNFTYLLTISFELIRGTSGTDIPPGVSMLDLQPHLLATPPPDPLCYPGYNNMPQTWDWNKVQPIVRDFKALIESDAEIYMGFTRMFQQIPNTTRYQNDTANIGPLVSIIQLNPPIWVLTHISLK